MADRKKKSFGTFKNEEKTKRSKTWDGGGKKNGVQKYPESSKIYWSGAPWVRAVRWWGTRHWRDQSGLRETFFSPSLQRKGLSCDFLAGEQWPSFYSMKRIPDLKVIHVRLIKSSSSSDRPMKDDCVSSSSGQPCVSEPVTPPWRKRKYQTKRAHGAGSTNAAPVFFEDFVYFAYDVAWVACQENQFLLLRFINLI